MQSKRILHDILNISLSYIVKCEKTENYEQFGGNYELVGGIDDVELDGVDEVVATNAWRRNVAADLVDDLVVVVLDQQVRPNPKWAEKTHKYC